jgi:hypothetical protein
MAEAPYEMANLSPKRTGLPFVIWISVCCGARHDACVRISHKAAAMPGDVAVVSIRPEVAVIEGALESSALALLTAWIELNRATLVSYWEGDIDTQDVLETLVKA